MTKTKATIIVVGILIAFYLWGRFDHQMAREATLKDWGWSNKPLTQEDEKQLDAAVSDAEDEVAAREQ